MAVNCLLNLRDFVRWIKARTFWGRSCWFGWTLWVNGKYLGDAHGDETVFSEIFVTHNGGPVTVLTKNGEQFVRCPLSEYEGAADFANRLHREQHLLSGEVERATKEIEYAESLYKQRLHEVTGW